MVLWFYVCFVSAAGISFATKAADVDPYCHVAENCVRNVNGAFGLTPKRTYRTVMSDDESVCDEIISEMNGAIAGDIKPWQTIPGSAYDNPLYSGPAFIRWKYLKGEPGTNVLQDAATDDSGYRWLVAPVFNDSKPVLVTAFAAILSNPDRVGEISEFWHIGASQTNTDWSDPRSYVGVVPFQSHIKPDEIGSVSSVRVEPGDDPLERTTVLFQYEHYPNKDLNFLPKLPVSKQDGLWRRIARKRHSIGNETTLAALDGAYYTLLNSGEYDVFLVFRLRPDRLGEDICYIESDLSQKLWRFESGDEPRR
jgi:hypothetical protein